MARSLSSSPLRKRPRLSSPTYDAHFADLNSDDFQALDDIEAKLSQEDNTSSSHGGETFSSNPIGSRANEYDLEDHNDSGIVLIDRDDVRRMEPMILRPQNPPSPAVKFSSASHLPLTKDVAPNDTAAAFPADFASAASLAVSSTNPSVHMRSIPSPEQRPEDVNSWFTASEVSSSIIGFTTASAFNPDLAASDVAQTFTFNHASGKSWVRPSSTALEAAKIKLRTWEAEIESELSHLDHVAEVIEKNHPEPYRVPLKVVENSAAPPSPAVAPELNPMSTNEDSRPNLPRPFKAPVFTTPLRSRTSQSSNILRQPISHSVLARSSAAAGVPMQGSILSVSSSTPSARLHPSTSTYPPVSSPKTPLPSEFIPPRPAPSSQASRGTPKAKPLGLTPRAHAFTSSKSRPKFVTPFKQGITPGEQSRELLLRVSPSKPQTLPRRNIKGKSREAMDSPGTGDTSRQVFDLTKPLVRKTLIDCGLTPQSFANDALTRMGLDVELFDLASVSHFLYYRFNPAGADVPEDGLLPTQTSLGADTALSALLASGCHLTTKAWVDNHWPLILWKMSGMSCLDPKALNRNWCWPEVIRQLRYRYTREILNGARPALRLITTHDAPASVPLVLCVSDVFWTNEHVDAEGQLVPAHPELELTDGWYRLRATVDEALARATRNRILRVGRKIACCGAKLESPKKSPMEVLDAYGHMKLHLSGNSTHLARWHIKLGIQPTPFVATLASLSSDGGSVPLMDLLIIQVFPVGYIEYITTESGGKIREGPRNEKDEAQEDDKWKEQRLQKALKLRDELEKKLHRLESYADSLERIAGSEFRPTDDESPPDSVEDLVEELADSENPALLVKRVNKNDAGWLSQSLRKKCEADREKGGDEIDRELAMTFPPREVRNFRVLRVQDARTVRRVSTRTAQLTVWDVMSLNTTEGGLAGSFVAGQRYMVTNLVASQQSAWMGFEPGSEVFLSTRRDSKWKIIH